MSFLFWFFAQIKPMQTKEYGFSVLYIQYYSWICHLIQIFFIWRWLSWYGESNSLYTNPHTERGSAHTHYFQRLITQKGLKDIFAWVFCSGFLHRSNLCRPKSTAFQYCIFNIILEYVILFKFFLFGGDSVEVQLHNVESHNEIVTKRVCY